VDRFTPSKRPRRPFNYAQMASCSALAGYLLVKKALDSVERLPRLGRTADGVKDNGDAANDDEAEGFQDLSTAVSTLKQAVPFAVGGRIKLCESDRGASLVILAAGNKQGVAGVLDRVDTAALLPHCTKATFGDSAQRMNREDPSVRVAYELAAGAWELSALGGEPRFLSVIRDRVQAALLDERQVVARAAEGECVRSRRLLR